MGKRNFFIKTNTKNIINLKKGQISKPIKINENFLILRIDDTKINKQKIDKNKILSNRISYEKNQQLERFSLAYFGKIKKDIKLMNYKPILIVHGEPNSIFLEIFFKSLNIKNLKVH